MSESAIVQIAGPLLVGFALNWGALGILSVQFCLYCLAFKNDHRITRCVIYVVFILLTAQSFFLTESAYRAFVSGFLDPSSLDRAGTLWFSVSLINGAVTFLTQLFYAYRIKKFGKSLYIPVFIAVLSLCQVTCAFFVGITLQRAALFSRFLTPAIKITSGIWAATGFLCDATIAGCMIYYLSRSFTGFKKTKMLLQRLIRLTIETGALTTVVALLNLIFFLVPGKPTYYQTTSSILGKIYAIAMLVLLNNRIQLTDDSSQGEVETPLHFGVTSQVPERAHYEMTDFRSSSAKTPALTPIKGWN